MGLRPLQAAQARVMMTKSRAVLQASKAWVSLAGVLFMQALAHLPLPVVRALGAALGALLWAVARGRKRVAGTNWAMYQSQRSAEPMPAPTRIIFKQFAQAWLDRSWLWHANPARVAQRIQVLGSPQALNALCGAQPVVVFAPHFVGLDAGWTALTCPLITHRPTEGKTWATIYTDQSDKVVDAWILKGRERFAPASVHARAQGTQGVLRCLRNGGNLYLLPDMDFGSDGAVFVPLFGTSAATVTSLSRFAKLAGAKVVPVSTRLTPTGYEVTVHPAWAEFPSHDTRSDAARMNLELTRLIDANPTQYWWLHKRFKTRPEGEASIY